jgi:two-component system phosphate regulon sensor histidine kinase PhoR
MLTFRQKIFLSYVFAFILFLIFLFPFSTMIVRKIIIKTMENRAIELINNIKDAQNNEALIRQLKDQKALIFFRVSVITNERKVLYDSHVKRLLGPKFSQEYVVDHPEVLEAFKTGLGFYEGYSELLGQKFSYMAKSFDFHGKPYVLRIAFPNRYIVELVNDFEMGFLILGAFILLLFSLITWILMNRLTQPIQTILSAVTPYEEGELSTLPSIQLHKGGTSEDITKLAATLNSLSLKIQKQISTLTQERNEKEVLLESLVEGVIAIDHQMTITYVNTTASQFLNLPRGTLIGQSFRMTGQDKCYHLLEACQQEQKPLTDTLELSKDGSPLFLDVMAAPKNDNTGALLLMQDKSAHYKILQMRKDFIANASHELKTPITIIRGFAETLHDNPALPTPMLMDVTNKIVKNCTRMEFLIRDLLALADIENLPESRLTTFNILQLAQKCCDTVRAMFPDADIAILEPTEIHIQADPDLIEMALLNLIQNAAKYSNPPAHIRVSLTQEDGWIKIEIADKGIGIPPEDLSRVFERFYRVDKAHSRKVGGSGLGLSIVQTVIQKHQGKISVASTLGQGTTFTILLPVQLTD